MKSIGFTIVANEPKFLSVFNIAPSGNNQEIEIDFSSSPAESLVFSKLKAATDLKSDFHKLWPGRLFYVIELFSDKDRYHAKAVGSNVAHWLNDIPSPGTLKLLPIPQPN